MSLCILKPLFVYICRYYIEQTAYGNYNCPIYKCQRFAARPLSTPCHGHTERYSRFLYAGSRTQTEVEIARRVKQIVSEGAAIIDIGAYSSRPNADNVSAREEMERLRMGLKILLRYSRMLWCR